MNNNQLKNNSYCNISLGASVRTVSQTFLPELGGLGLVWRASIEMMRKRAETKTLYSLFTPLFRKGVNLWRYRFPIWKLLFSYPLMDWVGWGWMFVSTGSPASVPVSVLVYIFLFYTSIHYTAFPAFHTKQNRNIL